MPDLTPHHYWTRIPTHQCYRSQFSTVSRWDPKKSQGVPSILERLKYVSQVGNFWTPLSVTEDFDDLSFWIEDFGDLVLLFFVSQVDDLRTPLFGTEDFDDLFCFFSFVSRSKL